MAASLLAPQSSCPSQPPGTAAVLALVRAQALSLAASPVELRRRARQCEHAARKRVAATCPLNLLVEPGLSSVRPPALRRLALECAVWHRLDRLVGRAPPSQPSTRAALSSCPSRACCQSVAGQPLRVCAQESPPAAPERVSTPPHQLLPDQRLAARLRAIPPPSP
eukprot:COSAG03_NODE_3953_length_1746_cov_1.622344_2_plen_166_part_00